MNREPIPTVIALSREGLSVTHMSREAMTSRLIDFAGRAPHLVDATLAISRGLAFVVLHARRALPVHQARREAADAVRRGR